MSETTEKLVGIKQVLLPEFKAAEKAGTTKGYMEKLKLKFHLIV